jgi:endonuclease III
VPRTVAETARPKDRARSSKRRRAPSWQPPARARVLRVRDRLREVYGIPLMRPHGHPIAELILTVLSQSTNDRNRDVAFLRLRTRFPSWEAVRDAPVAEIEEAIRPGGISKVKSVRIQAILRAMSERPGPPGREDEDPRVAAPARDGVRSGRDLARDGERASGDPARDAERLGDGDGALSLDWLPDVELAEARDYLTELPGVGRKTAACVLLFAYGLRDVPVDTHVSRVGARLHLLEPDAPFERMHDQMLALTPPGQELELHVNLLRHGRRTCHARSPECHDCALARMCPSRALFT